MERGERGRAVIPARLAHVARGIRRIVLAWHALRVLLSVGLVLGVAVYGPGSTVQRLVLGALAACTAWEGTGARPPSRLVVWICTRVYGRRAVAEVAAWRLGLDVGP